MRKLPFAAIGLSVLAASVVACRRGPRVVVGPAPPATGKVVVVEGRRGGGPPPWAPAHGYRRKVAYRYYPTLEIYFHLGRSEYFWLESGVWKVGVELPPALRVEFGAATFVAVDLDGDHPGAFHAQVKAGHGVAVKPGAGGRGRGGGDNGRGNGRGRGRGNGRGGGPPRG
jgi:hypothetical protein